MVPKAKPPRTAEPVGVFQGAFNLDSRSQEPAAVDLWCPAH